MLLWALRARLRIGSPVRELARLELGIDSTLCVRDLIALRVRDLRPGHQVAMRAVVMQRKTPRPVQFEIAHAARDTLQAWIEQVRLMPEGFLFSPGCTFRCTQGPGSAPGSSA